MEEEKSFIQFINQQDIKLENILDFPNINFNIRAFKDELSDVILDPEKPYLKQIFNICLTSEKDFQNSNNTLKSNQDIEKRKKYIESCKVIIQQTSDLFQYLYREDQPLLKYLISFLEKEPQDPIIYSNFALIFDKFLEQDKLWNFISLNESFLENLVKNINNFPISEIIKFMLMKGKHDIFKDQAIVLEKLQLIEIMLEYITDEPKNEEREPDCPALENIMLIIQEILYKNHQNVSSPYEYLCASICTPHFIDIFFEQICSPNIDQFNMSYYLNILSFVVTFHPKCVYQSESHILNIIIDNIENLVNLLKDNQHLKNTNTFGMGNLQIFHFFNDLIKLYDPEIITKITDSEFFPVLWQTLVQNKWNNILHSKILKIINTTFQTSNEQLIQSMQMEKQEHDIIKFFEDFYRKKHIFVNLGKHKAEFNQGNIGPLINIMLLFEDKIQEGATQAVNDKFQDNENWINFKKEKLDKVIQVWRGNIEEEGVNDNMIKLEKQWESYIPPTPPQKNNIMSGGIFGSQNLQQLPPFILEIQRDSSFIMTDEQDIKEIIMHRALIGCQNPNGCQNKYCRDNKSYQNLKQFQEADISKLLCDQNIIDNYDPCPIYNKKGE